jgi:hypothetical protein
MSTAQMTLDEVRRRGLNALARELGAVGMVRFLQQFETGSGDYTRERHQWVSDDVQSILDEIARSRSTNLPG